MPIKSKYPDVIKAFNAVPFDDQAELLIEIANHFDYARLQQLDFFKSQISKLERDQRKIASVKELAADDAAEVVKKSRRKPKPTHRSKKDKKLTWSGRGSMPRWMRAEMKELKLKPDAFLIKGAASRKHPHGRQSSSSSR